MDGLGSILLVERVGRIRYAPMWALQKQRHEAVLAGRSPDTLFLLEHEPVVTLGRNRGAAHVLRSRVQLAAEGIDLFRAERGGDATFHGPGQVVGYPVVCLRPAERDVRGFVHALEEIMIRTAADWGVAARRETGQRGVWVEQSKVGAVGVRVDHWTTWHGFAINVEAVGTGFAHIVPCGLSGVRVGALSEWARRPITVGAVMDRVAHHAGAVLGRRLRWATPTPVGAAAATTAQLEVK